MKYNKLLWSVLCILILAGSVGFGMLVFRDMKDSSKLYSQANKSNSESEYDNAEDISSSPHGTKKNQTKPEQLLDKMHPKATVLFTDKGKVTAFVFSLNRDSNTITGVAVINAGGELLLDDTLGGQNYTGASVKDINKDNNKELIVNSISEDGMPWCDIYQIKDNAAKKVLSVNGSEGIKLEDVDGDGEYEIVASSISDDTIYDWDASQNEFTKNTIGAHTVEAEPQTAAAPTPAASNQNAPRRTYTYYAVRGAVITSQDPIKDICLYRRKCEACGWVDSSSSRMYFLNAASFNCLKCGHHQEVEFGVYN